ncbi:unnamed protein product [Closterium sp. NIES-64]|nr:unnamed protein product [Closterium sp. NIES-65]CAI5984230.1 unnamed protein product [Closterium sp. NIES-64]
MELAYVHSIAYVVYDGFVSKVLMTELTGLDSAELERWKEVWEEVKILPTGMWTAMWARDRCGSGEEGGDKEKTDLAAWALAASACAVWCFVENGDAQLTDAVEEGKSAAIIGGASQATADVFGKFMEAVLNAEMNRNRPLGEVVYNVVPALQRTALDRVYLGGNAGVDADVIARAMIETMAFWGMCPVAGPKLRARDIAVPIDAQMKADLDNRGRKGLRGKKGTKAKGGTGKKGKKAKKDSTTA